MSNKIFFPHLDAFRFFAFLAVFVHHSFNSLGYYNANPTFRFIVKNFLCAGRLGVSFFFVLSGFLITYLLMEEKEVSGKIDIQKFYLRRILRIWPVYFVIVGLALLVFPYWNKFIPGVFPIRFSIDKLNPWLYIFFGVNFDYLFNGITNVIAGILWSVSIEEQFYLFWPIIIYFIPKKRLFITFLLIIAGSTLFRFYFSKGGNIDILSYHSFSCMSDLAIGGVLAFLCRSEKFISCIQNMPRYLIEIVYFVGFSLLPFREYIWKFGVHYIHAASLLPLLIASFFAFILLEQCYAKNSFYKAGNWKRVSKLGTYTYGMYCYHMTVFFLVLFTYVQIGLPTKGMGVLQFSFTALLCLLINIGVSKLSFAYFESVFLKLKNKFASFNE